MPTAAELRAEAVSLTYSLQALAGVRAVVEDSGHDLGLRGGSVAPVLVQALRGTIASVTHVVAQVQALVDELVRQANLCDRFTDDWRRYESRHATWSAGLRRWRATANEAIRAPWPGFEPIPPTPPFPGAEIG